MLTNYATELAAFPGREDALRKVTRYSIFPKMFYRSNLWTHSRHVAKIIEAISPLIKRHCPDYDEARALAMALVHDDAEMITGDVQAGNKDKMSARELAALDMHERTAVDQLVGRYPEQLGGYRYQDLLLACIERADIEAQAVQFADKLDAFGEALHEIFAGNASFAVEPVTEYGVIVLPFVLYTDYFKRYPKKYPRLSFLVEGPDRIIELEAESAWKKIAAEGQLPTPETLREPSGNKIYDVWKSLVLDDEEMRNLTTKVE
ncbi:MAG: YfbR-like 5'-deoxynucleotidase [Patescibacteria group bacterium]